MPVQRYLDGPIPGQSLTRAPGSAPWEQPPVYSDPNKAIEFMLERLTDEKTALHLCAMLDAGLPVSTIVHSLLLQGFTEGYWSPDLAILIAGPIAAIITKIATIAGVEDIKTGEKPDDTASTIAELRMLKSSKQQINPVAVQDAAQEVKQDFENKPAPTGGLMGMKGPTNELPQ